jgi:hypothetical protein
LVLVFDTAFVPVLVRVTEAFGMAALVESVTVPVISPEVMDWAYVCTLMEAKRNTQSAIELRSMVDS